MSHILRHTAIGLAVFAGALVAANVAQKGLVQLGWVSGPGLPMAVAAPAWPAPPVAGATASAQLRTSLLVDGVAEPISGELPVALADGSRFRLRLRSSEPGLVEVHTLNPQGRASDGPLWRGSVAAHGSADTPRLRLAGLRGMETLRVVHHSLRDGSTTEQQVQLLHR